MKKELLNGNLNRYKANLHCHTNISDGRLSPREIKEVYSARGYSVVAYTDHDVFIAHDYLTDDRFLALHGYELEFSGEIKNPDRSHHTCHMCFIQRDPDNMTQVCWNEKKKEEYLSVGNALKYTDRIIRDKNEPDFERDHTPEVITKAMQTGRKNGFFVTYNHPSWSLEDYRDYMNFHGMHAMEICNYSSYIAGHDEYNPRVYDDILRGGERIFCIGADDNHNRTQLDAPENDSFGAFTVIFAEKLDYRSVTDALFAGNFYASQGPEIYSLYCEDGKLRIKTSPANRIYLSTSGRTVYKRYGRGTPLTETEFDLPVINTYFRITVIDGEGKAANTNAYFLDDFKA